MNLDPLTFSFEIINFLVLIWLLQHFLYKPIRLAIQQRSADLELTMNQARESQSAADQLNQQLSAQLAQWDEEKARQSRELQQQLAQQRQLALNQLSAEIQAESRKQQSLLQQERERLAQTCQEQAAKSALQLCARLLRRVAGEELDRSLIRMLRQDLNTLGANQQQELSNALTRQQGAVQVYSARDLSDSDLSYLSQALQALGKVPIELGTELDEKLISGVRLIVGDQVLHANLGDELEFFRTGLINGNP